jgi:hypothetical protein
VSNAGIAAALYIHGDRQDTCGPPAIQAGGEGRDAARHHHAQGSLTRHVRQPSRPPDSPIRSGHRTPSAVIANSVVRAMSIVYVRCESVLGHTSYLPDLRILVPQLGLYWHAARETGTRVVGFKSRLRHPSGVACVAALAVGPGFSPGTAMIPKDLILTKDNYRITA